MADKLKVFTIGVMVSLPEAAAGKKFPIGFSGFILNVEAHEDEGYNAIYTALGYVSTHLRTMDIHGTELTAADLTP